jgi:hypothetical protein
MTYQQINEAEGFALRGWSADKISQWERHVRRITLTDGEEGSGLYERIIRATAHQRAEAFLCTIGKWREE